MVSPEPNLVDLRPVYKLKFVRCGPVENTQSSRRPDEVQKHLFPNRKIDIFDKISFYSNNSEGMSLKARIFFFWMVALYIHIKAPVKTEFAKSIIW